MSVPASTSSSAISSGARGQAKSVLGGEVRDRLEELVEEKAGELGLEVLELAIRPDQHLFIAGDPTLIPNKSKSAIEKLDGLRRSRSGATSSASLARGRVRTGGLRLRLLAFARRTEVGPAGFEPERDVLAPLRATRRIRTGRRRSAPLAVARELHGPCRGPSTICRTERASQFREPRRSTHCRA